MSECFIFRMVTLCELWALTWEESSAMRWRAACSIMYQRQHFKNSWGSLLYLVLSAGLSLCMSFLQSVHCNSSRFATPEGSWCLVKLSSCRQCLHSLFLSQRMSLCASFALIFRSEILLLSFFFSLSFSVDTAQPFSNINHTQIWFSTNLLLIVREGSSYVHILFDGHPYIQYLPVIVHRCTVLLHPWGMKE